VATILMIVPQMVTECHYQNDNFRWWNGNFRW